MSIVGGLDIHRKQLTFDYLDTASGEVRRGQICPADRAHLAAWLEGRFTGETADFAMEGCTGWRYVAEELAAAGITPHVGEPADTAALRGRKRHAKTDKTDSRHLRVLLADGRLPECWIPPSHILECRALLELYHDLRTEHTAWVQRITRCCSTRAPASSASRACAPARAWPPCGQSRPPNYRRPGNCRSRWPWTCCRCWRATWTRCGTAAGRAARQLTGARELHARLYGVGPVTALALCCWLGGAGRFSSARKAVRFTGLDITVWSSDRKGPPGRLSRQGPEVLRWCVYEAGKAHARRGAPDHAYYAQVKDRIDGKRAAISEARKIIRQAVHILASLGDDALTMDPARPGDRAVTRTGTRQRHHHHPMGITAASSRHAAVSPLPALPRRARGRPAKTERPHPPPGGGHPINHHVAGHSACPRA